MCQNRWGTHYSVEGTSNASLQTWVNNWWNQNHHQNMGGTNESCFVVRPFYTQMTSPLKHMRTHLHITMIYFYVYIYICIYIYIIRICIQHHIMYSVRSIIYCVILLHGWGRQGREWNRKILLVMSFGQTVPNLSGKGFGLPSWS